MHRPTVETYERQAGRYAQRRPARWTDEARAFASRCLPAFPLIDLGCGPGAYLPHLPRPAVAIDAAAAMLDLAGRAAPDALRVRGDLEQLPFRDRSLGGAWARNSYLHVERARLPLALAQLHRALAVGAPLTISVVGGDVEGPWPDDDIGDRLFAGWTPSALGDVLTGAGFEGIETTAPAGSDDTWACARRARTLADTVAAGMRLLVCGLNPSVVSADAGVGFWHKGNRFWPAAIAAGLTCRPRDAWHLLEAHGVGMTDLVKRPTPSAAGLSAAEYRQGAARVRRLVELLRPGAIVFVGLAGYRAAIDRTAAPGLQPADFGGVPTYVMASTSGLNARVPLDALADHLRHALAAAES